MSIYDLEQEILNFSSIIEDMLLLDRDSRSQALSQVYQMKFDKLWQVFEKHCQEFHNSRINK